MGECTPDNIPISREYNDKKEHIMCWSKSNYASGNFYDINHEPRIGVVIYFLHAQMVNRTVEYVDFLFNHYDYIKVLDLLKIKYGKPSREDVSIKQNKMGAKFESIESIWSGNNITILLQSLGSKVDEGRVSVFTKKYSKSLEFDTDKYKDKL
jgi:hypothetical protein